MNIERFLKCNNPVTFEQDDFTAKVIATFTALLILTIMI